MHKEVKPVNYQINGVENIQFPFYSIKGKKKGPLVFITAGIHGCEYAGIHASTRLYKELNPIEIIGQINIIPVVNMPAFRNKTISNCPIDNKDLNKLFPGNPNGSYSDQLVFRLYNDFIKGSDYYLDLHGGDVFEKSAPLSIVHKSGNKKIDQKSEELAKSYGLESIVFSKSNGFSSDKGCAYSYVSEQGIPSIQTELGGNGQAEDGCIFGHLKGLYNVLKYTGCLKTKSINVKNDTFCFKDSFNVYSMHEGIFQYNCDVGDFVNKGDILGSIDDYSGNTIELIKAPCNGKIITLATTSAVKNKSKLFKIATNEMLNNIK